MDFKYVIRRKAVVADIAIKKTTNCNSVERGKIYLVERNYHFQNRENYPSFGKGKLTLFRIGALLIWINKIMFLPCTHYSDVVEFYSVLSTVRKVRRGGRRKEIDLNTERTWLSRLRNEREESPFKTVASLNRKDRIAWLDNALLLKNKREAYIVYGYIFA